MSDFLPLVSVVMPSLNQVVFIEQAVESVLSQSYRNLELIVADGGSSDGTLDFLARKQTQDSRLKWFSGKDSGPANAINLALTQTRGTLIGWLNSDDMYVSGSVQRAVDGFSQQTEKLMLYGHGEHIDENSQIIERYPTLPPTVSIQKFKQGCFICQPSVFFQYSLFVLLGKLDEKLKTTFDFDYWLRAFSAFPERIGFIEHLQAYSRLHQDCITQRMRRTIALESMQVLSKYLGDAPAHWAISYVDELLEGEKNSDKRWPIEMDSILSDSQQYLTKQELQNLQLMSKKRLRKIT